MNLYDVFGESPWTREDLFPKDREYMKKIHSKQSRQLMQWIEDVCDEQEYDGSCIYDEYPDCMALERMAEKVYENAGKPEPKEWAEALIMSMLYNEICYRRCRRRAFKQRLYER